MKHQTKNEVEKITSIDTLSNKIFSDEQFFYRNIKTISNVLIVLCLVLLFYDKYSKLRYHTLIDKNNNKYVLDILTFQKWKKINYTR